MTTVSVPALVDLLEELSLLEADQQQELSRLAARCGDVARLLQELQRRQWLTAYQATSLLQGQPADLVLGHYLLLDLLGQGAMGQVHRARHLHTRQQVALKMLASSFAGNQRALLRFQREVQVTAQLTHPNIVSAYDAGQVGQTWFLAMEYVEGVDLSHLVKQNGPLPIPLACDLIRQAALVLQHAHDKDMIHRDVKPSNLMVVRSPDHPPLVKVLDFGLARILNDNEEQGRLTRVGKVLGTVDYIAPEQALDARRADARSDVFSLGATLFYILTGLPPYPGNDVAEKISNRVQGDALRLGAYRGNLPPGLEAVVATMLARDPAQRPASARAAAKALEPFCRAETARVAPAAQAPIKPQPAPQPRPIVARVSRKSSRDRSFMPLSLLIAGGVTFALIVVVAFLGLGRISQQTHDPDKKAGKNPPSVVRKTSDKDKGKPAVQPGADPAAGRLTRVQADLASPKPQTRLAAVLAIEKMKPAEARPALASLLARLPQERDLPIRRDVVRVVAAIARPDDTLAIDALAKTVADGDPATGKISLQAVVRLAPGRASAEVKALGKLTHAGDGMQQRRAIETLARLGATAHEATDGLVVALKDKQPGIRRRAATALGQMGPRADKVVPELIRLMQTDPSDVVRPAAADALACLGYPANKKAIPALLRSISTDASPAVRQSAVWALFKVPNLEEVNALETLTAALQTKPPAFLPVRYDAARLLARNKGPAVSDTVVALLLEMVRNKALRAGWEPGKAVWSDGMFDRRNQDGRFLAVGPLLRAITPERLPAIRAALEEAARDKDDRLRLAAMVALKELR